MRQDPETAILNRQPGTACYTSSTDLSSTRKSRASERAFRLPGVRRRFNRLARAKAVCGDHPVARSRLAAVAAFRLLGRQSGLIARPAPPGRAIRSTGSRPNFLPRGRARARLSETGARQPSQEEARPRGRPRPEGRSMVAWLADQARAAFGTDRGSSRHKPPYSSPIPLYARTLTYVQLRKRSTSNYCCHQPGTVDCKMATIPATSACARVSYNFVWRLHHVYRPYYRRCASPW